MSITIQNVIFAICLVVFLLPEVLLETTVLPTTMHLDMFKSVFLQLAAAGFVFGAIRMSVSQSQRLFWQFLMFSILSVLVFTFLPLVDASTVLRSLMLDFGFLLVCLFALLAIESNPHLYPVPLARYTFGRIPAIFFAVICFVYFVILPSQFMPNEYVSGSTSFMFALILSTLMALRLIANFIRSPAQYWRHCYLWLALGAFSLAISYYIQLIELEGSSGVYVEVVDLLRYSPYLCLIMAARLNMPHKAVETVEFYRSRTELYTLLLMMVVLGAFLIDYRQQGIDSQVMFYRQSLLIGWLFIGFCLIAMTNVQRNRMGQGLFQRLRSNQQQSQVMTKRIEKLNYALKYSEEKAIVEASNNAILTTDTKGKILSANPAALHVFQFLERELVDSNVSVLFAESDEMRHFFEFQSNLFALQRNELGISTECMSLRSDNKEFPVQVELQWAERQDQPLIVITFINLTSIKQAEQQALELKDRFIANISHEFRTPLTIINGIIERYYASSSDEDEKSDLHTAKRNGLRLVTMVEQMLELSRLQDAPQLSLHSYRLRSLIAMPVASFQRLAQQNDLDFDVEIDDSFWIECDAQGFEKILFNLLANAVKYTPAGGKVALACLEQDGDLVISISDSGIGINKSYQDKIFNRFQRGDDSSTAHTFGVGIGLSLVSELVKAHGWRINCVSEEGRGSRFSIVLPKAKALESESSPAPLSVSEADVNSLLSDDVSVVKQQSAHSQRVVLVIEDNVDMQSHIKRVIEQHHHCLLAGSGEQGLELANEYLPDLIVCDLMLPGIDGFEVLSQLKSEPLTAHIPVVLLTARAGLEAKIEGLNLQADEYLRKPFNQHELLTRISNLIDGRQKLQSLYKQKFEIDQREQRKSAIQNTVSDNGPQTALSMDDKFLHKLETLLAKHYQDASLDISFMAKELAVSERQLQRKMNSLLGINPSNFIKEYRLSKAVDLLDHGFQIGQIALDVGFSSQAYFGRCFKEKYQCTPKQYLKKHPVNHDAS